MAVNTIPDHSVGEGGSVSVDVSGYFSDADGDELSYMASSSNADVATASMDGSTVTIEGVGRGSAVITVTASDGSATAAQGFNVTVESAVTNQPPVAVGTIPGSRLQIGGTSTIDVAGYFSDPDGDELSYTGASSNEMVATITMDGSTAMIEAVAAGDAVMTITASDGSASVSQGFRIDVPAGPEEATVVLSRLLDANRQQISDPTGISGTIYAVLDVQSNDETWTEIGLTLNGETVTPLCRGTGGSSADVTVGPGLAAAGQVEIECVLKTNDIVGECVGMQLDPKYANGAYELSAFLTTDDGATREAVASQPIALNNHGFVAIRHMPGSQFELGNHTKGLTFYGGPAVEGNVNSFYACPVAYDGTTVGSMALQTVVTDTEQNPVADARGPTFRRFRGDTAFPVDDEAPFMWSIITDWWSGNHAYWNTGAENIPGVNETWIVNDGIITDPNGLDVSAKFRPGGMTAKLGPLHFDYTAPRTSSDDSQIVISTLSSGSPVWNPTQMVYYNDGSGSNPRRLWISDMVERGVGHVYGTTSTMAVGDCSVRGNADTRGSTAFTPLDGFDNVTHIRQLPEEDPVRNGVNDGGGIDCYVAELQTLADRLGNAVELGEEPRIRTATNFGVDRTPPVISRERPSEALVLNDDMLSFEIEDPRFDSGEDPSGQRNAAYAYAGDSRYWVTNNHYWSSSVDMRTGSATVDITATAGTRFAREIEHIVYIWARDSAGNSAFTSYTFTRDHSPPALALSAVPSDFGLTQAASVSVTVAGTLSDATEIRRAFLSIHHADANGVCTAANPLDAQQAANPVRRLHNGTSEIEFSEVFTVKKAGDLGATRYCFFLRAEDDARDANGGGAENAYEEVVGTFNVTWPGTKPAGPVATGTIANMDLAIGGTDTRDVASNFSDPNGDALTYRAASSDNAVATVSMAGAVATVTAVAAGTATITVTAEDAPGTGTAERSWTVTVQPDPPGPMFSFSAEELNVPEGHPITTTDATDFQAADSTYMVSLENAADLTFPVQVTLRPSPGVTVFPTSLSFAAATDELEVAVGVGHDRDVMTETLSVMHMADGVEDGSLPVMALDDDVALTLRETSLTEGGDAKTFYVVAELTTERAADLTIALSNIAGSATSNDFTSTVVGGGSYEIEISAGDMADSVQVTMSGDDDVLIEGTEMFDVEQTTASTSPHVVGATMTITDDDPNVTLMVTPSSLNEGDDATTLNISAESTVGMPGTWDVVVTIPGATAGYTVNGGTSDVTVTLTIDTGDTRSNTRTVSIDPLEDDDTNNITIEISGPAAGQQIVGDTGKTFSIESATVTITDNDS